MDEISALIREAKPLYLARKRRRNAVRSVAAALAIVWVGALLYRPAVPQSYDYYWDSEFSVSDNVSVIEEMGLPTDDYGLLMVS